MRTRSAAGHASGGTGNSRSPRTRSAARLVTSAVTRGAACSSSSTQWAAGRTCSKLSRMSSRSRSRRAFASRSTSGRSPSSRMPSVRAIAAGTASGCIVGARSTKATPSVNVSPSSSATASASRVLPTPPAPVRVTSRARRSNRHTSASSRSRPTKLVSGAGRLVVRWMRPRVGVVVPVYRGAASAASRASAAKARRGHRRRSPGRGPRGTPMRGHRGQMWPPEEHALSRGRPLGSAARGPQGASHHARESCPGGCRPGAPARALVIAAGIRARQTCAPAAARGPSQPSRAWPCGPLAAASSGPYPRQSVLLTGRPRRRPNRSPRTSVLLRSSCVDKSSPGRAHDGSGGGLTPPCGRSATPACPSTPPSPPPRCSSPRCR